MAREPSVPNLSNDEMPAGSPVGSLRLAGGGPWWLEGSSPRRLRRGRSYELPPALVVSGGLWCVFFGMILAMFAIPASACYPPRPSPSLFEVLGAHITGATLVVGLRVKTSRPWRVALLVPALLFAVATILAWSHPNALDMIHEPIRAANFRITGGIVTSVGV